MPDTQTNSKKKKATLNQLRRQLVSVRGLVTSNSELVHAYGQLLDRSDYFRVIRTNQTEASEAHLIDCLILLVVGVRGEFPDLSLHELRERLEGIRTRSTPLISNQLATLTHHLCSELWDATGQVATTAALLAQRKHLDPCEQLLFALDQQARKTTGSYYTPKSLARHTIENLHSTICDCTGLDEGLLTGHLSNDSPTPLIPSDSQSHQGFAKVPSDRSIVTHILDPAAGTGVFLLACLETANALAQACPESVYRLAQTLSGIELHPAVASIATIRLNRWCHEHLNGRVPDLIRIWCGDALRRIPGDLSSDLADTNLVIGNPPFSSLSTNTNQWIQDLIAGEIDGKSYLEIAGQPIGERKSWLHDDYIKFFRLAHYLVDRHRLGGITFISNRSFIDNITFRGMRWQLQQSFSKIQIEDLAKQTSLFPIAASVARSLFFKFNQSSHADLNSSETRPQIHYRNDQKQTTFFSVAPGYRLRPESVTPAAYLQSIALPDAFEMCGSTAITARDWFITDLDRAQLETRLNQFCDLSIPDQTIRETYFSRCRSRRYVKGDTRSWQMAKAREWLSSTDWRNRIRLCCYRPFDFRWILWLPEMIDWPRPQLMSCVLVTGNRTLVTRRQFPSGEPACYFWQVNDVTIDGIIRSDNRGNETLFPQWRLDIEGKVVSNFSNRFRNAVIDCWGEMGRDLQSRNELDASLFDYIYGLFHTPTYRSQFGEALSTGYPRVVIIRNPMDIQQLIDAGRGLSKLHLAGEIKQLAASNRALPSRDTPCEIDSPAFHQDRSEIAVAGQSFGEVSREDWRFRVGTHQVLRKWLQDRKGNAIDETLLAQYRAIIDAVRRTRNAIDQLSTVEMPR